VNFISLYFGFDFQKYFFFLEMQFIRLEFSFCLLGRLCGAELMVLGFGVWVVSCEL
jgi:hypothetical protein